MRRDSMYRRVWLTIILALTVSYAVVADAEEALVTDRPDESSTAVWISCSASGFPGDRREES